jgi:hypothetical protein
MRSKKSGEEPGTLDFLIFFQSSFITDDLGYKEDWYSLGNQVLHQLIGLFATDCFFIHSFPLIIKGVQVILGVVAGAFCAQSSFAFRTKGKAGNKNT